MMAHSHKSRLPCPFGPYELIEALPAGGMAEVFRARNPRLDKMVAIKILRADADAEMTQRFEAEAPTAAQLTHPNIVHVYDTGVCEGRPYIVMEFLDGCDLSQVIRENKVPEMAGKLRIGLQVAEALGYANARGVLHRDVKPSNIYVCTSGDAKLIDFGIAKSGTSPKTQVGFTLGTLRYMAPEQMHGQISDSIDVYAFGVVLYEFITGTYAVPGTTPAEVMRNITSAPLDIAPLIAQGTPDSLIALIKQCTAKSPAERPAGFDPVCAELRRVLMAITTTQAVTTNTLRLQTRSGMKPPPLPQPAIAPPTSESNGGRNNVRYLLYGGIGAVALAIAVVLAMNLNGGSVSGKENAAAEAPVLPPLLAHARGDMILVPAGKAIIGADRRTIDVPAFYIDKTEVTVAAWSDYCRTTAGCTVPAAEAMLPVTGVTFEQAVEFCGASDKRLPLPVEWEKAARGLQGFRFPWGNAIDARRANFSGQIANVGSYAGSASPYGALDMAGNVWEWVNMRGVPSRHDVEYFQKIDRSYTAGEPWMAVYGGSYLADTAKLSPIWDFALVPARSKDPTIGFRCAKSVGP